MATLQQKIVNGKGTENSSVYFAAINVPSFRGSYYGIRNQNGQLRILIDTYMATCGFWGGGKCSVTWVKYTVSLVKIVELAYSVGVNNFPKGDKIALYSLNTQITIQLYSTLTPRRMRHAADHRAPGGVAAHRHPSWGQPGDGTPCLLRHLPGPNVHGTLLHHGRVSSDYAGAAEVLQGCFGASRHHLQVMYKPTQRKWLYGRR